MIKQRVFQVRSESDEWGDAYEVVAVDVEGAAEDAAEMYWNNNDEQAWMRDGCTLYVRYLGDDNVKDDNVKTVKIEVYFTPTFYGILTNENR